jgi:hypothetical protein
LALFAGDQQLGPGLLTGARQLHLDGFGPLHALSDPAGPFVQHPDDRTVEELGQQPDQQEKVEGVPQQARKIDAQRLQCLHESSCVLAAGHHPTPIDREADRLLLSRPLTD